MIKCPHCHYTFTPEKVYEESGGQRYTFCLSCAKMFDLVNENQLEIKETEVGCFIPHDQQAPFEEIVGKMLKDGDGGFSGMLDWVLNDEVMSFNLKRAKGYVIDKSMVFFDGVNHTRHYAITARTLLPSTALEGG